MTDPDHSRNKDATFVEGMAHVWVHGTSDAQLAAMKRVAETLELVKTGKTSKLEPSEKPGK